MYNKKKTGEAFDMDFRELLEKVREIEFEDIFPLYRKESEVKPLMINVGIYMGIIVLAVVLIMFLGGIKVLGVFIWIIGVIAILYSIVGMGADLLKFMKYN